MSDTKKETSSKSVHFSSSTETKEDLIPHQRPPKRKRPDYNEDELDDIDDYVPSDEEEEGENGDGSIPSVKERIKAQKERKKRRENMYSDDEEDDENDGFGTTNIDQTTSLASDGIEIEPFNMEKEKTDGTGYFDGDTYIFRNNNKLNINEEPDAWLDNLQDSDNEEEIVNANTNNKKQNISTSDTTTTASDMDNLSNEQLYEIILPLVSDDNEETIMQALIRYGNLLKRKNYSKKANKEEEKESSLESEKTLSKQYAQKAFNDLTTASNSLLLKGKVDIYEKTRNDLVVLINTSKNNKQGQKSHKRKSNYFDNDDDNDKNDDDSTNEANSKPSTAVENGNNNNNVKWEYRGSQDGLTHGPYTTEQMISWISAGYFIGANAVNVRTVTTITEASKKKKPSSAVDDLLSDLMDDDDEDDAATEQEPTIIHGEWKSSNDIDFKSYIT